ncbi:MAG: hypothetical protein ACYTFV_06240 [Planctomycetota bacterium]
MNPWVTERSRLGLAETSPSRLLFELLTEDPLRLRRAVRRRLGARALLLDVERVFERAAARAVYLITTEDGSDTHGASRADEGWIDECVDGGIGDCLSIDEREARLDRLADRASGIAGFEPFGLTFGAGPELARRASVDFHGLPEHVRRLFIEVVVEGRRPDVWPGSSRTAGCERENGLSRVRADLERALDAVSGIQARNEQRERSSER